MASKISRSSSRSGRSATSAFTWAAVMPGSPGTAACSALGRWVKASTSWPTVPARASAVATISVPEPDSIAVSSACSWSPSRVPAVTIAPRAAVTPASASSSGGNWTPNSAKVSSTASSPSRLAAAAMARPISRARTSNVPGWSAMAQSVPNAAMIPG